MSALTNLSQTWNLEGFFPGGSESAELAAFLQELEADLTAIAADLKAAQPPASEAAAGPWINLLERYQELATRLRHAGAFVGCLSAQDMKDKQAMLLGGRIRQLGAALSTAGNLLDGQMLAISDPVWAEMLAGGRLSPIAGPLTERRRRAREKFEPAVESLVGDLGVDGYHAWGHLYDVIVGRMSMEVEEAGKSVQISMGQAANRMRSGDRPVRAELFRRWEEAWAREADLCAEALNHLGGYRLSLYKHRGWESILKEPLENNRVSPQTLAVMWETIDRNKGHLLRYLERKAELLGVERLAWHDVHAPLSTSRPTVSYDAGANFIVEQFGRFNPAMAEFAAVAFRERWIEAEDRPGKRPGGFCTSLPLARESRIFMTYAGHAGNVATLAHELGHAYHGWVMKDLPWLARGYGSSLAETASTFAEMVVDDAALRAATEPEARIAILAAKAERAISFLMDIHSRFLFETRYYAERARGPVAVARLNQLMEAAQRDGFKEALAEYHPHFWAAKLHFYITGNPLYNWPYTFGYLFSSGVYARARSEGAGFAARYDAMLRDTGVLRVEELAERHLGVDLTRPAFWEQAISLSVADVEQFLSLTGTDSLR